MVSVHARSASTNLKEAVQHALSDVFHASLQLFATPALKGISWVQILKYAIHAFLYAKLAQMVLLAILADRLITSFLQLKHALVHVLLVLTHTLILKLDNADHV